MRYCFYITDHGYGHASRSVAIISALLTKDKKAEILIKSDRVRCDFIRRNLPEYSDRIKYFDDCHDVGIVLKPGTMDIDRDELRRQIVNDQKKWEEYIDREYRFIIECNPDIVVSDIICWPIESAYRCNVPSVILTSFTWFSIYKGFFGPDVYGKYLECYKKATKAVWYEMHDCESEKYIDDNYYVSLVSRKVDNRIVKSIVNEYKNPIVFVSLGKSAQLSDIYDVSDLPFDFLVTKGIELVGENVHYLPEDMINTPDYIGAAEYVIVKGGWSTIAEVLLQNKKCGLLFRDDNYEDEITKQILESRKHCFSIDGREKIDFRMIIQEIRNLNPKPYDYRDSSCEICDILIETTGAGE